MKSLDLNHISGAIEQYKANKLQNKFTFPLKFLLTCGWDKLSYDDYLIRYQAGTLEPNEQEPFKLIYSTILEILSEIEYLSAYKKIDYYFYKTCMEQFAGSGLVSKNQQKNLTDRINKYKKQQELINSSGLEIK